MGKVVPFCKGPEEFENLKASGVIRRGTIIRVFDYGRKSGDEPRYIFGEMALFEMKPDGRLVSPEDVIPENDAK